MNKNLAYLTSALLILSGDIPLPLSNRPRRERTENNRSREAERRRKKMAKLSRPPTV